MLDENEFPPLTKEQRKLFDDLGYDITEYINQLMEDYVGYGKNPKDVAILVASILLDHAATLSCMTVRKFLGREPDKEIWDIATNEAFHSGLEKTDHLKVGE